MPTEVASTTATATNTATTATKTTTEESKKENGVNSNQLRQPPTSGSKPESTRNANTYATSTVAVVTKTDATTQTTTVAPTPAPLPPQLQAHPAAHHHHPPPPHHVIPTHHFMSPYGVLPVAHFDPNAYTNAIRGTPLQSSVPNTVVTHKAAVAISSRTAAPARSVVVSAAVPTSAPAPAAPATATTATVAAATNTTTNNNKNGSDVSTADVLQVGPCDVLCGRGGATNNHNGNRRFRRIVAEHQKEYLSARKRDKRVIAEVIVARVRKEGGRFLKREVSGRWTEVDDRKACEKTSQALREGLDVRRKVAAGETSPTTTMSDTETGTTPPAAKRARTDDVVSSVIPASGTDDPAAANREPSKTAETGDATKTKGNGKAVNGSNPAGSVVPI